MAHDMHRQARIRLKLRPLCGALAALLTSAQPTSTLASASLASSAQPHAPGLRCILLGQVREEGVHLRFQSLQTPSSACCFCHLRLMITHSILDVLAGMQDQAPSPPMTVNS
jgi:hypothetical protein